MARESNRFYNHTIPKPGEAIAVDLKTTVQTLDLHTYLPKTKTGYMFSINGSVDWYAVCDGETSATVVISDTTDIEASGGPVFSGEQVPKFEADTEYRFVLDKDQRYLHFIGTTGSLRIWISSAVRTG